MRFLTAKSSALACSAALPTMGTMMHVKKGIGTFNCRLASVQQMPHSHILANKLLQ